MYQMVAPMEMDDITYNKYMHYRFFIPVRKEQGVHLVYTYMKVLDENGSRLGEYYSKANKVMEYV